MLPHPKPDRSTDCRLLEHPTQPYQAKKSWPIGSITGQLFAFRYLGFHLTAAFTSFPAGVTFAAFAIPCTTPVLTAAFATP